MIEFLDAVMRERPFTMAWFLMLGFFFIVGIVDKIRRKP